MVALGQDRVVVGTYLDQQQAERAAEYLRADGIDEIALLQPSDAVWQVEVGVGSAEAALRELMRVSERAVESHY